MNENGMLKMKRALTEYMKNQKLILIDRAFIGLYAIFMNLKKKTDKRKVLFTSISCPFPMYAAIFAGFEPVYSDINLVNFLMDPIETCHIINTESDIAAIVYIYIFGHISKDILEIKQAADKRGVFFIEDVAQAFGCEIEGEKAGSFGDVSVFSFGYSKQIDFGGGGAVVFNSGRMIPEEIETEIGNISFNGPEPMLEKEYRDEFYKIRQLVIENHDKYELYRNFHLKYRKIFFKSMAVDWDSGKQKFENFMGTNEKKERNDRALAYANGLKDYSKKNSFVLPDITGGCSIWRYTFLVGNQSEAKQLSEYLRNDDINCSNHYLPVSRFYHAAGYSKATDFAERVINLWVDEVATEAYIEKTLNIIKNFYESQRHH